MAQRNFTLGKEGQKFRGKGWYVVPRMTGFPLGCGTCDLCKHTFKSDQVVYAFVITLNNFYCIMHKDCMVAAMEDAPLGSSDFSSIRERVLEGGSFL